VILLPEEASLWPSVGRDGFFEVLIHWPGQVRLFPLDAGMRSQRCRVSKWSGADWEAMTRRHPVGMTETGTVTDVFTSDRTYGVQFDDFWSLVEYDQAPPTVGTANMYTITRHLEWTRRILVKPSV
jgi:hypothetical protein